MPTLSIVNFNIVCATLGGFITVFGSVSYLSKEKFYLSEALISLVAGSIFSPHATNLVRPLDYALGSQEDLNTVTLYFTRLVLGVQSVLAGVQLPSKYLQKEWRPLSLLLGPAMCGMWISTSLLIWGSVPDISFLFALAVGACVTPTDPISSNSIVKGKFADKNIPRESQKIIVAESGANDGLGYPFLFLPLYSIKYTGEGGAGQTGGAAKAMGYWFGETWGYTIILSVVYGAVVGWIAKESSHWAEERKYVDRESFLVFAITLALFIVGTVGMIGSDDVLACFIAGNVFTWDDWFRLETLDDSLQPTIDMLLNVSIFMWFGAICPWYEFAHNSVVPIYRSIPLGILVLLLRRSPVVLAMHKKIHQIEELRQALFVGFFGPIGVSAIFYLYVSSEFLRELTVNGVIREDAQKSSEIMNVVIWFIAICSMIVHGISIPLGKSGFYLPRTISAAISSDRASPSVTTATDIDEPEPFHVREHAENEGRHSSSLLHRRTGGSSTGTSARPLVKVGQTIKADVNRAHGEAATAASAVTKDPKPDGKGRASVDGMMDGKVISGPTDPRRIGRAMNRTAGTAGHAEIEDAMQLDQVMSRTNGSGSTTPSVPQPSHHRTIRFPDEEMSMSRERIA